MKKFINFMVVVVVIFAVAVLTLAFMQPKDVTVTRSVLIKAPKEVVFEQMSVYKNWPNWSPWTRMDTAMKMTYFGTEGQAGSGYKWDGSARTGSGEWKTTEVNGTQMDMEVRYTEPYEDNVKSMLKATDTAGITKATWSMTMHKSFPMNASFAFIDMDKLLGGDFTEGLNNIKAFVEGKSPATPVSVGGVEIKEVDFPAHLYQGVRNEVSCSGVDKFSMDAFVLLSKSVPGKIAGPATGIYYIWDTVNASTDMMAAFPVSDTATTVSGVTFAYLPASKAVMAVQKGGYYQSMASHAALVQYMTAKGKTRNLAIEEYIVGPKEEADSNKWVTNIYYILK